MKKAVSFILAAIMLIMLPAGAFADSAQCSCDTPPVVMVNGFGTELYHDNGDGTQSAVFPMGAVEIVSAIPSLAGAFALALGIGVQNFPEGAAVGLPVYQSGKSKRRAFWTGVLSGAVEPLFGALVVLAAAGIHALMPWLLSFAAGAMLYVVAEELLPRAGGRRGTCGFLVGFLLMMILDVALG